MVIFTASLPEYADPVIDWLDGGDGGGGLVAGRLFRSVGHVNLSRRLSVTDALPLAGLLAYEWRLHQRLERCRCRLVESLPRRQ